MNTTIQVVRNDKLYDIPFTLEDSAGAPVNISGASLLFKAQHCDYPTIKFSGAMSIVSGAAGTCKYTVQATDFDTAGDYQCEIQVTFGGAGQIQTWNDIFVTVAPDLAV